MVLEITHQSAHAARAHRIGVLGLCVWGSTILGKLGQGGQGVGLEGWRMPTNNGGARKFGILGVRVGRPTLLREWRRDDQGMGLEVRCMHADAGGAR